MPKEVSSAEITNNNVLGAIGSGLASAAFLAGDVALIMSSGPAIPRVILGIASTALGYGTANIFVHDIKNI